MCFGLLPGAVHCTSQQIEKQHSLFSPVPYGVLSSRLWISVQTGEGLRYPTVSKGVRPGALVSAVSWLSPLSRFQTVAELF